ncbi:hypothetical protein [Methylobacter svalbardensis]
MPDKTDTIEIASVHQNQGLGRILKTKKDRRYFLLELSSPIATAI